MAAAAKTEAQFIELRCWRLADHFDRKAGRKRELKRLALAAVENPSRRPGRERRVRVGYLNVGELSVVPRPVELNIGHSIVSRAISVGLANAVTEMLDRMKSYRG
ncbi:MAG: pyridoxine 5'-phosphate synthase [Verrucomicrobiota bacterium]